MIKIRQIQFFLSVIQFKSFIKAAESLNVSQPGVSKAIRELEEILQVKLIKRFTNGIEITEYGRILENYSHLILKDISNAEKEIKSLKDGTIGDINIGVAFSPRIYLVPKATINLQNKYPNINLNIYAGSRSDLILRLLEGKIDLFVSAIVPEDFSSTEKVSSIPLYKDTQFLVTRTNHPLQSKKNVSLKDTLKFDWILPEHEKTLNLFNINNQFWRNSLKHPSPKIVYNSANFALNVIKNSDYIGIHPKQMIETQGEDVFRILDIEGITMEPSYGITYLENKLKRRSAELLIEELILVSKEMITKGLVKPIVEQI
tara:strand:+ start:557 stop:1504 length:948 start_codon:yes stop_codon:yes gene_type:complete